MRLCYDLMRQIKDAAAKTKDEICGLLYQPVSGVIEFEQIENRAPDPSKNFYISPESYAEVEDKGEVIAVVHSHGVDSCNPSDLDVSECEQSGLEWLIVGGDGETWLKPSSYIPPLVGREFKHGSNDCWGLIVDWYKRERDVTLTSPVRVDGWWDHGGDMYRELLPAYSFKRVDDKPKRGDVILMQLRAAVPNHAAVYLGGNTIMHHLDGRLSETTIYGGMWEKITVGIYRYVGKN